MLEINNGYLCLYGKKYSELNTIERHIFSTELRELKENNKQKKTTSRSGKTEV